MENQRLYKNHTVSSGQTHSRLRDTRFLVTAALLTALCCAATMAVRVPTPTMGYVHIGDGMVLLSGVILGPWYGALAGGIGSMFSDLFSGYAIWAPGTFLIKAVTALLAGLIFRLFRRFGEAKSTRLAGLLLGFVSGEAFMVLGYFLYNVLVITVTNGAFSNVAVAAAFAQSLAEIPFNAVQGGMGILTALVLLPFLSKIPGVRGYMAR